jgi:signal transduction histidine kinase
MHRHVERELARARAQGDGAVIGAGVKPVSEIWSVIETLKKLPHRTVINYEVVGEDNIMLAMNPEDFAEVVGNLIDNARKWAISSVLVEINAQGSKAVVSVSDDGPGIRDEQQAEALARGVRLDEKVQGSGLGLSIVEALLENYGSKVELGRADAGGLRASFEVALRQPK